MPAEWVNCDRIKQRHHRHNLTTQLITRTKWLTQLKKSRSDRKVETLVEMTSSPVWQFDPIALTVAVPEILQAPLLLYQILIDILKWILKGYSLITPPVEILMNICIWIMKGYLLLMIMIMIKMGYPRPTVAILVTTWQLWGTDVPIHLRWWYSEFKFFPILYF